ncbi:MAG: hypothetical protein Pg6B_07590 [Candidatus Azobacteroides pseudotrichonymphae]|jgi:outer membrane protein|nr:MAG: hypothetical protein Pg6B_07590 [Candidatus Azobacteroides pseudotrichonymphae]
MRTICKSNVFKWFFILLDNRIKWKRIVVTSILLLFIIIGVSAQEKVAYLNYSEIIKIMPEYIQMQDSIKKIQTELQNEMNILKEEYEKKYKAFISDADSLVESIKMRRMQEIKNIEERAGAFQEQSQKQLQQMYEKLFAPIQWKVKEAIRVVGEENDFVYIFEGTELLYTSSSAINVTPFVKRKLGLK